MVAEDETWETFLIRMFGWFAVWTILILACSAKYAAPLYQLFAYGTIATIVIIFVTLFCRYRRQVVE